MINKTLFSKSIKDKLLATQDKEAIDGLELVFQKEITKLKKQLIDKLYSVIGGKASQGVTNVLGEIIIPKSTKFTQKLLQEVDFLTVDTKKSISLSALKKLSVLKNTEVINHSKDKKNTPKRIYDVHYKKLGKTTFLLDLFLDGGIPIKSFVQNSDVNPNVSDLLENQCLCKKLDFKNIIV